MRMTTTPHDRVREVINRLLSRVRSLRDCHEASAPPDNDIGALFTNTMDYDVGSDVEVHFWLHELRGLATGLGFRSAHDLYDARDNLDDADTRADVDRLVAAADGALRHMAGMAGTREVVHQLGRALATFKGKAWR